MPGAAPKTILICPDQYNIKHVGRTGDGKQFFLTTPFVPAHRENEGREFIALYLFDARGNLVEARIDDLGPRAKLDEERASQLHQQRLHEIAPATVGRIRVKPFEVERFGVTFGLIAAAPKTTEDPWWVTAEPGNYLAFTPPWDGRYDT